MPDAPFVPGPWAPILGAAAAAPGSPWERAIWVAAAVLALAALALALLVAVGFAVRARSGERLVWDGVVGCVAAGARPRARCIHRTRAVGTTASPVTPCSRSSKGRTSSRKVTKLDTGWPGRPTK